MTIIYFLLFGLASASNITSITQSDIPVTFDARKQWTKCRTIGLIPNEGSCKSSWAYIPASVLSDRVCIYTYSEIKVTLSAREILSCAPGYGCQGGTHDAAWNYLIQHGVSTGGEYNSEEGCQPYEITPCSHTGKSVGSLSSCSAQLVDPPVCQNACTNVDYKTNYSNDLYYAKNVYKIPAEEAAIQQEIMSNGPVQASILLYNDLYNYTGGIYDFWSGKFVGVQNVKIIGWDQDSYSQKYWLVVNTWGVEWGDNGIFHIHRGDSVLGIEDNVYGVEPLVSH